MDVSFSDKKPAVRDPLAQRMHNNLHALNRSMENIEGMIARSRHIMQSRSRSKEHKDEIKLIGQVGTPRPKGVENSYREPEKEATRRKQRQIGKIKEKSFLATSQLPRPSFTLFEPNSAERQQQCLNSIIKPEESTPKNMGKTYELTPSNKDSGKGDLTYYSTTVRKALQEQQNKNESQNVPPPTPYILTHKKGCAVYKFSPQKTIRVNSLAKKGSPVQPDKSNKIKIKIPHIVRHSSKQQTNESRSSHREEPKQQYKVQSPQILIEDEEESEASSIPEEPKARFKTDYAVTQDPSFDIDRTREEPSLYLDQPSKKINLKLFESSGKRTRVGSARQQTALFMPQPKPTLVEQLSELQGGWSDEQQRYRKFRLKIKRYGFVQKYLSEQQVDTIYQRLVRDGVNELKWPIYIVDEVYRRMKQQP